MDKLDFAPSRVLNDFSIMAGRSVDLPEAQDGHAGARRDTLIAVALLVASATSIKKMRDPSPNMILPKKSCVFMLNCCSYVD